MWLQRSFRQLLILVGMAALGRATSVVPPSFSELVAEADAIYRGRVTAVAARRVAASVEAGSVIKTFVTFAVERVLKGPERNEVTLEFLGGSLGDERLEVSGMPTFSVGGRDVVFVQKNGAQFCPLVALMHGRYRVVRDDASAREHVARDNGTPLTATAEVELPMTAPSGPARAAAIPSALTPEAFETSILSEVRQPTLKARLN